MIHRILLTLSALLLVPAVAHAQDSLALDTAAVEDLTAIREIKHLQAHWGHLGLRGQWQDMAELLTEDVVVEYRDGEFRGRAEVLDDLVHSFGFGNADGLDADRLNIDLWISPVITLDADGQGATGRWHELLMGGHAGESADWAGGTWVVRYVQQGGAWKIAHMRYYHQFDGPYAEGWSHDAADLERASYHYTPDEAGRVLTGRVAASPMSEEEIDRQASLLLEHGRVQNIANAFGYYLDRGMYDDVVDLFYRDARVVVHGQGSWEGQDGVRRFLARFGEAGLDHGELNDHPQLMPKVIVTADARVASVSAVEIGMTGQHGGEGFWSATLNHFVLMREEDGRWRIASLLRIPFMRANHADGWASPVSPDLPWPEGAGPDRAMSQGTMAYPEGTISQPISALGIFAPPVAEGGEPPVTPGALAMAEAFDGAENVSNAYGYYIDQFAWRDTAALFARDGWKELSYIGTFIGQDRVLGSLIQRYGEGGPRDEFQAIHQKTQPVISVSQDGLRAFIRTRLMQMNSGIDPASASWIGGIYENQVVKEDGIWRIHGMDLDYVWLADNASGWMAADPESSARFGVSEEVIAEFAPDAPLRGETFAPYPRIAPMGFHFANPVSGREPATRLHWSDGHRQP